MVTQNSGLIRPYHPVLALMYRLVDIAIIFAVYYVLNKTYPRPWTESEATLISWTIILFLMLSEAFNLYRRWRSSPLVEELMTLFMTWVCVSVGVVMFLFITKTTALHSRIVITSWFIMTPIFLSFWKSSVRYCLRALRKKGFNTRSVAVLGVNDMSKTLIKTIQESPWLGLQLNGVYEDRSKDRFDTDFFEDIEIIGTVNDLIEKTRAGELDIVYIALPFKAEDRIQELIEKFADSTSSVYLVADLMLSNLMRSSWMHLGDLQVMSVYETGILGVDGMMKRMFDLCLLMLILPLCIIPMAIIALLIKLTSKGPVFFKQDRFGLNGQHIKVVKFRSMTVAENHEITQAKKNDSRVTPLGRFLRRTSLDEIPQLFNILKGDMTFVGPRPHAIQHNEIYRSKIHGYMLRHKVKPGLTGWAQVNGWRGETETLEKMEKRVEYDLYYIEHWSLLFDVMIIMKTIKVVLKGSNAY